MARKTTKKAKKTPIKTVKTVKTVKTAPKGKVKKSSSSAATPVAVAPTPPAQPPAAVAIAQAKGRPMLTWVGKRPLRQVTAFPAQLVERFEPAAPIGAASGAEIWKDWPAGYSHGGLLFHGDNKEVLAHLLANGFRGKVDLVYIDPPFDSAADYVRKVSLRGPKGLAKVEGEAYVLGEQLQYTDIWANDNYLQFMYERLLLLRELLAAEGTLFLHIGWHKHHHLRCLLDEVFSAEAFRNEIVVKRGRRKNLQSQFEEIDALGAETDAILVYSRSEGASFSKVESDIRATGAKWKDFWRGNVDRKTMRYAIPELNFPEPERGQLLWSKTRGRKAAQNYVAFVESGEPDLEAYWRQHHEVFEQQNGHRLEFVTWDGKHNIKYWIPPKELGIIGNLWADIETYSYKHDYKTEKHEALLSRIVAMASEDGDLILDCFLGSGTTVAVAQQLGRRWIGCDINRGAIQTTVKRLQAVIADEIATFHSSAPTLDLEEEDEETLPAPPAQLCFSTWRVNDYDLQIQHNEAVNLAAEHLGVERTRSDGFFDGLRGKTLVKIIPFGHPLSPTDLEEIRRELDSRPDEDRPVTVVSLGMEHAATAWLEDWNRMRKGKNSVNRIEVIELRTDPRYGKWLVHQPASAKVKLSRMKESIRVEIDDFISPTIIERLANQAGILSPKIENWRAMVDCVMIDPAYDGQVFNVALSDVPERKADFVQGTYELPALAGGSRVAVKIVDMLGEEVLVIKEL